MKNINFFVDRIFFLYYNAHNPNTMNISEEKLLLATRLPRAGGLNQRMPGEVLLPLGCRFVLSCLRDGVSVQ